MRRLALLIVCGIAWSGLTSSCQTSVSEEDLLPTIAKDLCSLQQECDCQNGLPADQCEALVQAGLGTFFVPPANAHLTYDPDCGGQIVDAYNDLGCDTLTDFISDFVDEEDCRVCKLYYGDKADGQECSQIEDTALDDCGPGLYCLNGKCGDPCKVSEEGEPCYIRCADGLLCTYDLESGDATCKKAAQLGESCEQTTCDSDLVCDSETLECAEPPGSGEPCFGSCADPAWCDTSDPDSANWICKDPQPNGASCEYDNECESLDCDSSTKKCNAEQPFICSLSIDDG